LASETAFEKLGLPLFNVGKFAKKVYALKGRNLKIEKVHRLVIYTQNKFTG